MTSAMRTVSFSRCLLADRGARYRILRRPTTVYHSTNRHASGIALPDKFQGRRTTLEVKIPDLEEPEISLAIDPANIPFVPDHYQSAAVTSEIEAEKAEKAGTPLPGDTPLPKVVTVSAENTIPGGGGVSSNIFQKSADIKEFVGIEASKVEKKLSGAVSNGANLSSLEGWKATLGNLQSSALDSIASVTSASSQHGESDPHRTELDGHDVNGLYVLGGIVVGGWLLGRVLSKKGVEPAKHTQSH